jgi:hypothetical protein
VSPHDGAVDHQPLEVGLCRQHRKKAVQGATRDPAVVAALDGLMVAEPLRQVAPARTGTGRPEQRVNKQPVVAAWSALAFAPAWNQIPQPRPLIVAQPVHVATRHGRTSKPP